MTSKTFIIKNFKISSLNDFLKTVNKDKTILEYKDNDYNDVYLIACINGHLEIMKYLEKKYNWNTFISNNYEQDAFLIAVKFFHYEILKYIKKKLGCGIVHYLYPSIFQDEETRNNINIFFSYFFPNPNELRNLVKKYVSITAPELHINKKIN